MNSPNEYSYDEMLEKATEISPNAKPVFANDMWYIVIATGVEPRVLDDRFKGTPAWKKSDNGTSDYKLREWAGTPQYLGSVYELKNLASLPVEAIAEYYNLSTNIMINTYKRKEALKAEAGCTRENYNPLDSDLLSSISRRARIETLQEFDEEINQLKARWDNVVKF